MGMSHFFSMSYTYFAKYLRERSGYPPKIYKAYISDDVIEFGTEAVTLLLMMEQTPFAVMEISLNLGDFPFHRFFLTK
jgi:hypothetical protein